MLTMTVPIGASASNDLYTDMVSILREYNKSSVLEKGGLKLEPSNPTQELGYMQVYWKDNYKKVHEEWGDYWVKDGKN